MLNEEVLKYRRLSGDNNPNTSISRISGYLDGYQQGRADAIEQYTCHDDCTSDNCSMCIRWNKLADFYQL